MPADLYLLRKRADAPERAGLYWRPNGEGYTPHVSEAGRYTRAEAEAKVSAFTEMLPAPDDFDALVREAMGEGDT